MKNALSILYGVVLGVLSMGCTVFAQKPSLFFLDLTSGPAKGGDKGNGALVTVYGNNFGSDPSVLVGNKPAILNAPPSAHLWYQRLTLQIPSGVANGETAISVSNASGASNALPFTVRAGRIVNVTSAAQLKAARSAWKPGDIYYLEGNWSVPGDDGTGMRSVFSLSSEQGWTKGTETAPIAIVGKPRSNVTIGPGADFGIRGGVQYLTIANLAVHGSNHGVVLEFVKGVRIVGNDLSANVTHTGGGGCLATILSSNLKVLGNNVHNCGTAQSDKLDHAIYFGTDSNDIEEAWNGIHDNQALYGTQFHSTPLSSGLGNNQFGLRVHDNQFYNQAGAAVNFATIDPSKGPVDFYNNLVYNTGAIIVDGGGTYGCVYLAGITNAGAPGTGAVQIYNNTFYGCGKTFLTDNDSYHPVVVKNNIVQMDAGRYLTINQGAVSGTNNIWFGSGRGPRQTDGNINADPKFANPSAGDFRLLSGSPAIDAGQAIDSKLGLNLYSSAPVDLSGSPRTLGASIDLGCYESSETSR